VYFGSVVRDQKVTFWGPLKPVQAENQSLAVIANPCATSIRCAKPSLVTICSRVLRPRSVLSSGGRPTVGSSGKTRLAAHSRPTRSSTDSKAIWTTGQPQSKSYPYGCVGTTRNERDHLLFVHNRQRFSIYCHSACTVSSSLAENSSGIAASLMAMSLSFWPVMSMRVAALGSRAKRSSAAPA